MAGSEYYDHTSYPQFAAPGSSAPMRAELDAIEAGFDKCVPLAGNASKFARVKVDESGQEAVAAVGTGSVVLASGVTGTGAAVLNTDPTFVLTDTTTNNVSTSQHGWAPKLPGNTTQFLRGDGTYAIPTGVQSLVRSARSSNTILGLSDLAILIEITSGTFTQTITAAATLTNGWFCWYYNSGTGDITIDPNGAETIDGLTSYVIYPGEARLIMCTGTAFFTVVVKSFSKTFTTTGANTFTTPPGYRNFDCELWNGGNSGGRRNGVVGTALGGGGGGYFRSLIAASAFGASQTVTVGAGGAAVAAGGVADGNVGVASSIGTLVVMQASSVGGNGSGLISQGVATPVGFEGQNQQATPAASNYRVPYGGAGSSTASGGQSGNATYGGAAGANIDNTNTLGTAGTSRLGGNGGAGSVAGAATAGIAPGGGGGATDSGTSGAGARGEVRIHGMT